ncbi:MAG: hypothetical protein Q8P76_02500 [bacterium]|nr:hypothetical protein [bacterium]
MFKNTYFKVLLFAVLILIIYFGQTHTAEAAWWNPLSWIAPDLNTALAGLLGLAGQVAGAFLGIAGALANWSLQFNQSLLSSPLVQNGWLITRDLANLGFVLAIIVIAFATILRLESYEMKKTIGRLIIAALLVNFSLVIAGVFLDFSAILTNFFITRAGGNDFGAAIASSFKVNALLQTEASAAQAVAQDFGIFIMALVFITVLTIVAAVALLALAGMLITRALALMLLLITAPLAWLAWVIPDFQSHWNEWWNKFFKWVWFAPMAAFFIYLAVVIGPTAVITMDIKNAGALTSLIKNLGAVLAQMITVIGILLGGLKVSSDMGSKLAGATITKVNSWKDRAVAAPGKTFQRVLRTGGYQSEQRDERGNILRPGGSSLQRITAKFTGVPVVGGAVRAVNQWAAAGTEERKTNLDKELASMAKSDPVAFANAGKLGAGSRMNDPVFASTFMKAATENNRVKDLQQLNPAGLIAGMQKVREQKGEKDLYKKNPLLAKLGRTDDNGKVLKEFEDVVSAEMTTAISKMAPKDLENISPEAFETPEIIFNFTQPQFKFLSNNASGDQLTKMTEALNKWQESYTSGSEEWKALARGNKVREDQLTRGLDNLDKFLTENPSAQVLQAQFQATA